MARVFVSHASEDRECAGQLHRWLVAEGHEVFLDQDLGDGIAVGEEWNKRLHERLRWADAMVCVVTSAAVASTWCSAEVGIALSRGSRLLPVRAEPGVDHPLLKSIQHADLTVDPTAGHAALLQELRRVDAAGGWGWPDDLSPFPGLRPFDVEHHRVFFGRTSEVEQLARLLRSPAERAEAAALLLVGPSGCGKSSLVRAGLLSTMANTPGWWTLPPILPGADPVAALIRQLATAAQQLRLGWTVAQATMFTEVVKLDGGGAAQVHPIGVGHDVLIGSCLSSLRPTGSPFLQGFKATCNLKRGRHGRTRFSHTSKQVSTGNRVCVEDCCHTGAAAI